MKNARWAIVALALMAGSVMAFRTDANALRDRPVFGYDQSTGTWIQIAPGMTYECLPDPQQVCTAYLVNDDPSSGQIDQVVDNGDFQQTN